MLHTRVQAEVAITTAFYADTALEALATISQQKPDAGDDNLHEIDVEALVRYTAQNIRDRREQSLRNSIRSSQQRQFQERSASCWGHRSA